MNALCVAIAMVCQQPAMPPAVQRYFAESERQRIEQLAKVDSRIAEKIADQKRRGINARTKQQNAKDIAELKRVREVLVTNKPPFVPVIDPLDLKVGQVGLLRMACGELRLTLQPNLNSTFTYTLPGTTRHSLRVFQVIKANEVIVEPYWYEETVEETAQPIWVVGVPTAGMTTKADVKLDQVFHVSGTRSYQTISGATKTVFVIEPVDVDAWIKK